MVLQLFYQDERGRKRDLLKNELKEYNSYIKNELLLDLLKAGNIEKASKATYGFVALDESKEIQK